MYRIVEKKQQKRANLRQKRYFKSELKHSKRFDHATDDVMSLFGDEKNYLVEHYFPANILCRVKKGWLSTALGLVSRLFRSPPLTPLTGYSTK